MQFATFNRTDSLSSESWHVFSHPTRKPHPCIFCGDVIPAGSKPAGRKTRVAGERFSRSEYACNACRYRIL